MYSNSMFALFIGRKQVMNGVQDLVHEVQVEATFPDGTKLVSMYFRVDFFL